MEFIISKVEKLCLDLDEASPALMSASFIDVFCECFLSFPYSSVDSENLLYS